MQQLNRRVRTVTLTAVLALLATMVVSTIAPAQGATPAPYVAGTDPGSLGGRVSADGSSTVGPITEAVAEEFGKIAQDVEVTVDISGTGGGFKRFCAADGTDIQDASRPIKPEEAADCEEAGVDYYVFEVAYDGISVVVNSENDWVTCLTVDQLKQLWNENSEVTAWSDLDPSWPDDEIALYGPGTDSGTYDYFTEAINGAEGVSRTDYTPSEDDNVLVQGVAGDPNALGFFGFAYYEQNQDSLNLVGVDSGNGCMVPSTDSIRDGSYAPLSRPLYLYVKAASLTRPEVQEFVRFYLANAQTLVADVGYVDSPVEAYLADQARLEAAISGNGVPDSQIAPATPES